MGNIAKVLALEELEPRTITATGIWSDLCEDIHLHYRNLRLDFSEKEWASFRAAINMIGRAVEQTADELEYEEGNPNFLVNVQFEEPLSANTVYYPNRLSIELERDNTVHIHYRDLRIHMTIGEFVHVAGAFKRALITMDEYNREPFPFHGATEAVETVLDIKQVQPYDAGHRPGVFDEEHRAGIEFCKAGILGGKTIRPILVNTNGQRMDGFKRYMAHKELGIPEISAIVDPNAFMGGQNNQSMFLEEEDGAAYG